MLNVVIITNGLHPVPAVNGGGAEILIQNILKQNEELKKAHFIVYSVYDKNAVLEAQNYKFSEFRFFEKKKWGIRDLFFLSKHFYYKVICGYTVYRYIYDYNLVYNDLKNLNFDYIVIENTLTPFHELVSKYSSKVFIHLHNELLKASYPKRQKETLVNTVNNCAGVITVSQYIKNYSLYMGDIDDSKFHVLRNCIDITSFYDQNLETKYSETNSEFTYIFVGRICKEKGILELMQAFSRITFEDARLILVGEIQVKDKTYREHIEKILAADKRIKITGYVQNNELKKILHNADCAVLPSVCGEACPLTVIECMSAGLPIITTNTGGIPEIVDEKCAILLNLDESLVDNLYNTMIQLYRNYEVCNKMSKASINRIMKEENFDLKGYFLDFIKILQGEKNG